MTTKNSARITRVAIVLFGLTTVGMAGLRVVGHLATRSKLGEACLEGCRSGLFCYDHGLLGYCTKECAQPEDCPEPYLCAPAGGRSICKRPPNAAYGDRCWGGEECTSGLCYDFSLLVRGRTCRFSKCAQPCGELRTCPEGSECADARDGEAPVCVPVAAARAEAERAYAAQTPGASPPSMCW